MVEKFFLGLDYKTDDEVYRNGTAALGFLRREFGSALDGRLGVKLNVDVLTGSIDPRYKEFAQNGSEIFADLKLAHGYDTGERTMDRLMRDLPVKYVTIAAGLCTTIMKEYVKSNSWRGVDTFAFTVHTKIPEDEARRAYAGSDLDNAILNLGQMACEAGCHAIVLEGEKLQNPDIVALPTKKLVTGIRIDPSDKGTQSRVTALGDLAKVIQHVNYVVVSKRYVGKPESLVPYFAALL